MFKKIFLFSVLLISCFFLFSLFAVEVKADGDPSDGQTIENPIDATSFDQLAAAIIEWVVTIGISIAVIMIIYAGFLFMIAGGVEDKVTKARKTLIWALVGLAILIIGENFISIIRSILSG